MKTSISRKARQLASALLVAMCISAFLCICITGYLSLAEHQSYMSARSQAWNIAISVTEAGVEEGLAQLNCSYTNLSNNGWTLDSGTGSYYRSNSLPDGNSYTINIWTTNAANPVIIARAYTIPPSLAKNQSTAFFAAVNTPIVQPTVTRAVKVTCSRGNLFLSALVARHSIELNGNGILTDSYSSNDPSKSTNGKYDASKYTGDMGDVASNGGIHDAVNLGNGNIYGKVHISPSAPLSMISVGSNGGVGTHAWQASNRGAQPGYEVQDANFTFPETPLPDTSSGYLPVPNNPASITTTNFTYSTNSISTNSYPGAQASMVTNYNTTFKSNQPLPLPGSYIPSSLVQHTGNSNGWDFYHINFISSYNFTSVTTNSSTSSVTYDHILSGNGKYYTSALTGTTYLAGPAITLVLSNGLSGAENITWSPAAYLTIYAGGTTVSVAGNNYINPYNGYAGSLIVYCAPTVTSFSLSGNGEFTGVLVAPDADLTLNGGGSSPVDFCGSIICNSATLNGHYSFHYDEALQGPNNNGRWLANSWNEISY